MMAHENDTKFKFQYSQIKFYWNIAMSIVAWKQPSSHLVHVFMLHWQSWMVQMETIRPPKSKMFNIQPFSDNAGWLLLQTLAPHLSIVSKCWWIQIACNFAKSSGIRKELLNCLAGCTDELPAGFSRRVSKVPDGDRFLPFISTKIRSHSLSCSKGFD